MFVTNERTQIKVVGADGSALDVVPYLDYFQKRVFTGMNVSESMMGRGGTKQDADSMEEQAHNIVKDDQASFALQFQNAVIDELLLEGGFNPILNEDDIVRLEFREINLDTKVKVENHEINKFEKNAITFEELRRHLGEKSENVDENRLFSQMFAQKNALEQIQANAENALELARVNASLQKNTADGSDSYVKKNTGNGKSKDTVSKTKSVSGTDTPSNQHGSYSAKVKETLQTSDFVNNLCEVYDGIAEDVSNHKSQQFEMLAAYREKMQAKLLLQMRDAGMKGSQDAFISTGKEANITPMCFDSNALKHYVKDTFDNLFSDIDREASNTAEEAILKDNLTSMRYRLCFLVDFATKKAYWYSFAKSLAYQGVKEMEVTGGEDSKHKTHYKIIPTSDFTMNDIPSCSSGCHCRLVPVKEVDD